MRIRIPNGFLVLAVSSTLIWHSIVSAQTVPTLPTVQYANGAFDAQWLPYGKKWALEGALSSSHGRADLVRLSVQPRHPASRGTFRESEGTSCWLRNPEATDAETKFRIVNEPLALGKKYDVRLEFYQAGIPAPALRRSLDAGYAAALSVVQASGGSSRQSSFLSAFTHAADSALIVAAHEVGLDSLKFFVSNSEGMCTVQSGLPALKIPPATRDSLQRALSEQVSQQRAAEQADSLRNLLAGIPGTDEFRRLVSSIRSESNANAPSTFAKGDSALLSQSVVNAEYPGDTVLERLRSANMGCRKALGPSADAASSCALFGHILDVLKNLHTQLCEKTSHASAVKKLNAYTDIKFSNLYVSVGRALLSFTAWNDADATSNKFFVGTQYSYGAAFLGPFGKNSATQAFSDISLKFYFNAVDKSLPDPYFGNANARFSLAVGLVGSTLSYRGQAQSAFVGSAIPKIGLSWDLIGVRDGAIQLGWVFFRQPSINPAASNSTPRVIAAPFISLGFDFDLANKLLKPAPGT